MPQLSVVTLSQTGKTRKVNEDCFLNGSYVPDHFTLDASRDGKIDYQWTTAAKQTVCLAVFDEVKDVSSDGTASRMAAKSLKSEIGRLALLPLPFIEGFMQRYVNHVNKRIRQVTVSKTALNGTGATFACLCLRGNQAAVYNFGDCSAYLYRQSQLRLVTTGTGNDSAKYMSRSKDYLGMSAGDKPLICAASDIFSLHDQDCFLLCSKSLTDSMDDAAIRSCLNDENPQRVADQLVSLALAKGCQESITITVARWSEKETRQQIRVSDASNLGHQESPNPRIEHEHQVFQIPVEKKKIKPEAFKLSHIDFLKNMPFWLQVFNLIAILGLILFLIWLFKSGLFG